MERLDRNSPITKECIWTIRGTVVHGHGRGGTKLGFPTANVGLDVATTQALLPLQNWVYFGWGCVEGRGANGDIVPEGGPYPLVMSVGYNPHFKDKMLTVEAYFLHKFESDFYGEVVRILSCGAIREQGAFTTLEALIETIRGDCRLAEEKLAMPEFSVWRRHAFLAPLPPSTDPLPQLQTLARPCSL